MVLLSSETALALEVGRLFAPLRVERRTRRYEAGRRELLYDGKMLETRREASPGSCRSGLPVFELRSDLRAGS